MTRRRYFFLVRGKSWYLKKKSIRKPYRSIGETHVEKQEEEESISDAKLLICTTEYV